MRWAAAWFAAVALASAASGLMSAADRTERPLMAGMAIPDFHLPSLIADTPGIDAATFRQGEPRLLNVFASWCLPCIAEIPQLMKLQRMGVPIEGIAVRDTGPDLAAYLRRHGSPYRHVGDDARGKVQLALGVSGVPATFVIDGRGRIVLAHPGDIRDGDVAAIAAVVRQAR